MSHKNPMHDSGYDPERINRMQALARLDDDNLRRRLIRAYDQNWNGGTDRMISDVENAKEAE